MLQTFYPDLYMDSAYGIDYEEYYRRGFRGIIFDIDNTLVEHGAPADERSIALMERLKKTGFQIMLLSNNKEPRVKMFNDKVHVSYILRQESRRKEAMRKLCQKWVQTEVQPCLSEISFLRMYGVPEGWGFFPF